MSNGDSGNRPSKDVTPLLHRLTDACNGHPYAKIAWPHRLLHEARDEIERLARERDEAVRKRLEGINLYGTEMAAIRRVIDRHAKWRETALGFLRQVIDGRATEDEWPALAEFLERSDSRMVESSSDETSERLVRLADVQRRFMERWGGEGDDPRRIFSMLKTMLRDDVFVPDSAEKANPDPVSLTSTGE